MLKNIISPVQAWLISQDRCVGCGSILKKYPKIKFRKGSLNSKVVCKCKRIYIYEGNLRKYRRALLNEI